MAAKHKDESEHEAKTKLHRLLETEAQLEALLESTRQEAKELVEAAENAASDRIKRFELQLEGEEAELKGRIARDRDATIDAIQKEARRETKRLDDLDDAKVMELARHVIDLLVGVPDARGSR